MYPLISHVLAIPEMNDESPVHIIAGDDLESVHSSDTEEISKEDPLRVLIYSLRTLPISFTLQLPAVEMRLYDDSEEKSIGVCIHSFNSSGQFLCDFLEGISLNDTLSIAFEMECKDIITQNPHTSFSLSLTPSMDVKLDVSSIEWSIDYDSLCLLLKGAHFFSLLPSKQPSITREKQVVFGLSSKKEYLLKEELKSFVASSCFISFPLS